MRVCDYLHRGIDTLADIQRTRHGDPTHAEIAGSEFLDRGQDDGVEVLAYVVADGEDDLDQVLGVA
jgi:hypothetical protein